MTSVVLQLVPAEEAIGEYLAVLWDLVVFFGTFVALYLVGRRVVEPVVERSLDTRRIERTAANTAVKVVRVVVFVAALRIALDLADYGYLLSLPPTLAAAVTVALGFASRDIASNLVSGAFIVTDPKFNIGDWIRWQDKEGIIEDISFRVTRVRTFDNELLTVPNSQLATNAVVNSVAYPRIRISHTFHVSDEADLGRVASILVEEANDDENVLDAPTPTARVVDLDNSLAGVQARFWIADPTRERFVRIRSAYFERVRDRFDAAGIDLPANR